MRKKILFTILIWSLFFIIFPNFSFANVPRNPAVTIASRVIAVMNCIMYFILAGLCIYLAKGKKSMKVKIRNVILILICIFGIPAFFQYMQSPIM